MDGLLRKAVIASGGSAIRARDYLKKITQTVGQERNYGKIKGIGNGPFNYAEKRESGDGLSFREENYNFDGRLLQSTSLKGRLIRNRGISLLCIMSCVGCNLPFGYIIRRLRGNVKKSFKNTEYNAKIV